MVLVNIDGVNFYASHYASFDKPTAIKKMIEDGLAKNKTYAATVYGLCVKAVADKSAPK